MEIVEVIHGQQYFSKVLIEERIIGSINFAITAEVAG